MSQTTSNNYEEDVLSNSFHDLRIDNSKKQPPASSNSTRVYAKQQPPPRNTRASSLNKDEENKQDNNEQVEVTGEQVQSDSLRSSVALNSGDGKSKGKKTSSSTPGYSYQQDGRKKTINYSAERVIGSGSFGVVYLAKVFETGESVAIKKVLQDKRFKNRELQIMKMLTHTNVVEMKHCFFSKGEKSPDEEYLNLVLEYVPDTVFRFCCQYAKNNTYMPLIYVKLFTYQLLRSLNYIHSMNICHRDIKPQNLLIDPVKGILKLCDFGSAKQLTKGEPNVAYICSRYYRAPELIFGSTKYTTAIDIWSAGCVLGELLICQPLFPGDSSVDQLVEIIRVLGTPTKNEIEAMNKDYTEFRFPHVKACSWSKIFADRKPPVTPEAIDLITQLLQYNPTKRIRPLDALAHPFFDELRDPKARLPNGKPLPNLFDFDAEELRMLSDPNLKYKIIPKRFFNSNTNSNGSSSSTSPQENGRNARQSN